MRALVLSDGKTFTTLAGCRLVEIDDALHGADVDTAIKHGNYTELQRFNGTENTVPKPPRAFSQHDLARLRELLLEYATLHEHSATLAQTSPAQRNLHARDAQLLRRQANWL